MKQLVAATGMEFNLLSYYLKRLCGMGLVRILREEPRNGRATKLYEAVAASFFVPSHLAAEHPFRSMALELQDCLDQAALRQARTGTMYSVDAKLGPRIQAIVRNDSSSSEHWRVLRLSESQARQLGHEMEALLTRYGTMSKASGGAWLAHCAVAAREPKKKR